MIPKPSKKKKLPPIRKLLKKADTVFSLWIRNRDGNKCVLCGSTQVVQCGHLIKRGKHSTRFDELNCNAQCSRCNFKHNQYPEPYTAWFLTRFGYGAYLQLTEKSKELHKFTRSELEEIIRKYQ